MANIKFSAFTTEANPADIDFLVGFEGTTMKKIVPSNITGAFLPLAGGTLTGALIVNAAATATVYKSPTGVSLKLDSDGATGAELLGNAANTKSGSIRFNCEQNTHGVTLIGPPHSASATYTLTLPTATGSAGQVLSTNGSGVLSFTTISGGATSLNGLTDCLVDTDSLYVGEVPAGLSGNPQGNTILGIDSGSGLTSGFDNTFIGRDAAKIITDSDRMVVIGSGAASSSSSNGDNCVVIGYQAHGSSMGSNNVAVGYQASALSGVGNGTVVGYRAGRANTGASSVFVGYQAAQSNQSAGHISVGYQAGFSQTSGVNNTNLGYQAGYSNTTGGYRTMVGYESGKSQTANFATGFGFNAMKSGAGTLNVAVGSNAMTQAGGSRNTAVGHQAMLYPSTADDCVAIGSSALQHADAGDKNVVIGVNAGLNLTGANNVLVGYGAGDDTGAWNNTIIIGKDGATSPVGQSNHIVLGNSSHTVLQIPGIQAGASNGDVLTFNSSAGKLELQAAGGGGATSLNGLTDCLVDTDSLYVGEVPSGLSGNPQGNTVLGIDSGNALTSGLCQR